MRTQRTHVHSTIHRAILAIAFVAVAIPAAPTQAQPTSTRGGTPTAKRALAIEDYYKIKTVGSVSLSPDARWVSFSVSTRVEETNGSTSEIWLVPFDGSVAARRVSPEGVSAGLASWLENGRLMFTADGQPMTIDPSAPDKPEVGGTPAAGTGRGTGGRGGRGGANGANGARIASPDARMVAYVRDMPPPKRDRVWESDFEKRHQERFKGVQFDWLDYQRDGQPFPLPNVSDPNVSPPQEIFVAPAGAPNGDAGRQLTRMGLRPAGVQWSLDGSQILFTGDSLYRSEKSYGRSEAWLLNVSAGTLARITPDTRYDYRGARYSPDGKWILVTRQFTTDHVIAKKLNHGGATDLVVLPAAGGAEKNLTADWDYLPGAPQWSPDGRYVYFTGGVGGTVHLFRASPETGAVQQLTNGERRIGDLQFDQAMTRIVYTVATFDEPSDLWSANIDGTGERRLTRAHETFMADVGLSRTERLQFKSPDGTPVEGWITLPYGYSASGGPYPLIVSNHGGPHSAIQYGLNFKNQYFAANGFAVLEVNFRSSTGYGEKHLWGTWGAWGTKDGQDVMAGVDLVLAKYALDRKKVASIGHSYGGFMTNWLITQYPDRFAAAASGAGIVNWLSDYGNADIARTKETEFFGTPWQAEAREIMIRQSPLTYAGRAKTPTLFINGEIDHRVPFTENEQLYVALKKNGVPAKMIRYDDMPHGISGNWNVLHRMLNERQWFDQWMKTKAVP